MPSSVILQHTTDRLCRILFIEQTSGFESLHLQQHRAVGIECLTCGLQDSWRTCAGWPVCDHCQDVLAGQSWSWALKLPWNLVYAGMLVSHSACTTCSFFSLCIFWARGASMVKCMNGSLSAKGWRKVFSGCKRYLFLSCLLLTPSPAWEWLMLTAINLLHSNISIVCMASSVCWLKRRLSWQRTCIYICISIHTHIITLIKYHDLCCLSKLPGNASDTQTPWQHA